MFAFMVSYVLMVFNRFDIDSLAVFLNLAATVVSEKELVASSCHRIFHG